MANLGQDLVFGIRMLLARPGFTIAAVLSLALGIGANGEPADLRIPLPSERTDAAGGQVSRRRPVGDLSGDRADLRSRVGAYPGHSQSAAFFALTPRYFETMKIQILRGRDLTRTDTSTAPLVMIVNKTMADRFWEGKDPIGQSVTLDFVTTNSPARSWESSPTA